MTDDELLIPNPAHIYEAVAEIKRLRQEVLDAKEVVAKAIAWKEGGGAGQGSNLWGPTRLESDLEDAVDALLSARETS